MLQKISVREVQEDSLSFELTFAKSEAPPQMDPTQWSKAVQEGIAGKLSIAADAVTLDSQQPDDRTVIFSLTAAALYVAGLLPPALETTQQEGESVKVKLSTLKKMTAKTSEKVKQTKADLETLRAMLVEHDERAGNVDHQHSRNDMIEGIQVSKNRY